MSKEKKQEPKQQAKQVKAKEPELTDKEKQLQEALAEIQQRFGEGAIMQLSGMRSVDVDSVSSGSIALDVALGVGGVPRGRMIEIYGAESSGKCVKSDTVIFSELGMLPISSFGDPQIPEFQKKEVFVHSEHCYEKTSHFYNGGLKPTIKIKTSYGYEIEGTANHRIRVIDKDGNYIFRRLDSLQETDFIAIQRRQKCFGKGVNLSDFDTKIWPKIKLKMNTSKKDFQNFKITESMAKLMGYMIGDGTCTNKGLNKNNIIVTIAGKESKNEFIRICKEIFGEKPKRTKDKRSVSTEAFRIFNVKARAFLYYAGVSWSGAGGKEVPWSILCSPKRIVANFLKALFECDGGVTRSGWKSCYGIEYCSKSEKLIRQIQIILLNFGIVSKTRSRYNEIYKRYYYYLVIDGQKDKRIFAKEIGFISNSKQKKLENSFLSTKQIQTNRDTIPNLNRKLKKFLEIYREKIRSTHRADWKIFNDYIPGGRRCCKLSYERLKRILKRFSEACDLPEYQNLEFFYNLGFFWDKIVLTKRSLAHVMDFTVPSNATFCGNGFVNHNTTLALHILAQAQKKGGTCAFVDAEHALDPDYAKKIGVSTKNLLISQPDSGEQALQIVEALVRSKAVDAIVVDSVAALTPKAEVEGEIGDVHMGRQARLLSQAMRKLAGITSQTNTIIVFLNQTRMKIGIVFGNPITTPGGMALKFYSSVRIQLSRVAQIKKGDEIIGSRIRAKIVKNKVAAPFKTAEFDIYWNEGISKAADLINTGLRYGVVEKAGSWYNFGQTKLGQGIEGVKQTLLENKQIETEIKKAVYEAIKNE